MAINCTEELVSLKSVPYVSSKSLLLNWIDYNKLNWTELPYNPHPTTIELLITKLSSINWVATSSIKVDISL